MWILEYIQFFNVIGLPPFYPVYYINIRLIQFLRLNPFHDTYSRVVYAQSKSAPLQSYEYKDN